MATTNRYKQLLTAVPKGDFYASDGQVLPNRSSPYQIRLTTATPNALFNILLNDNQYGSVISDSQSVALLNIQLVKGTNVIKLVNALTQDSTSATVTTRDYATTMAAEAEVIENLDQQIEQVYADSRLATSSAGLIESVFGSTVGTANDTGYSLDTYRDFLQELRVAYRHYGGTVEGMSRAVRAFTGISPLLYSYEFGPVWLLGQDLIRSTYDLSGGTFYLTDPALTGSSIQGSGAGVSVVSLSRRAGVGTGSLKWTTGSPGTLQWESPTGALFSRLGPAVPVAANGRYTLYDTQYTSPIIGQNGPYHIVTGANHKLTLEIDSLGLIVVTLTAGAARTATQIAADINAATHAAYDASPSTTYNAVASSVGSNACVQLSTPTSGSGGSIKIWPTTGPADAAQTLFNLPFVRAGLLNNHSMGVTTLQLSADTDMTPWPLASADNQLNIVIGRTTYQPAGSTIDTAVSVLTAISAVAIGINKSSKTLTLAAGLSHAQPLGATVELMSQLPMTSQPVSSSRPIVLNVTDYTKLPGSTTTATFTVHGTGLPDGWVLTDNSGGAISAEGPTPYSYFPVDTDMPIRVAVNSMIALPIGRDALKYLGYGINVNVWASVDDMANSTAPTTISTIGLSFDGGSTYTDVAPTTTGETCNSLRKPSEYAISTNIPSDATGVWMRIKFSSTGDSDVLLHRVRAFIPSIHTGMFLGDGTTPRNETKAKSGYLVYVWSPTQLTTTESDELGTSEVTQVAPGHIDTIAPASVWLDKFDVSEYVSSVPINIVGAFSDADFTVGQYSNMQLVLRAPSRFTYMAPLTTSTQVETITWSAVSDYTLVYESDQDAIASVVFKDGIPLDPTSDWSFVDSTTIQLNVGVVPTSVYTINYNTLQRFTTEIIDLGTAFADYNWFLDYHVYTRPEIIPESVSVTYGVQFDSTGVAQLLEPSNQDKTQASLIADTGTAQIPVPISAWSFTGTSSISISASSFNSAAIYTFTYTALTNNPHPQVNILAEYRTAATVDDVATADYNTFNPNDVVGNVNRYYQLRLTITDVRDIRDYRLQSLCLKGLNAFGTGGTIPVLRPD